MSKSDWESTQKDYPNFRCIRCNSNKIEFRIVEDSECHEDYEYHCINCNRYWWVEGSDY